MGLFENYPEIHWLIIVSSFSHIFPIKSGHFGGTPQNLSDPFFEGSPGDGHELGFLQKDAGEGSDSPGGRPG